MDDDLPPVAPLPRSDWPSVLARCTPSILSLRVASVRSHEGSPATVASATGFICHATTTSTSGAGRALILTNRHVVTTGPVNVEAVFLNKEEVPVRVVYVDPTHDFAFLQLELHPAVSRNAHVCVCACACGRGVGRDGSVRVCACVCVCGGFRSIALSPSSAAVGVDVKVVGNDAGEKLAILGGTLARLDRPTPVYGHSAAEYNDLNTFYIAAASGTSGGSSGSPVLTLAGVACALNAGGKRSAASSFYLPLDRPLAALQVLTLGLTVPRGELQIVFTHEALDEVKRLGLKSETEEALRAAFPSETGALVVEVVCSGSHAAVNAVGATPTVGDVLVALNGTTLTHFTPLAEACDATVAVRNAYETLADELELREEVEALCATWTGVAVDAIAGESGAPTRTSHFLPSAVEDDIQALGVSTWSASSQALSDFKAVLEACFGDCPATPIAAAYNARLRPRHLPRVALCEHEARHVAAQVQTPVAEPVATARSRRIALTASTRASSSREEDGLPPPAGRVPSRITPLQVDTRSGSASGSSSPWPSPVPSPRTLPPVSLTPVRALVLTASSSSPIHSHTRTRAVKAHALLVDALHAVHAALRAHGDALAAGTDAGATRTGMVAALARVICSAGVSLTLDRRGSTLNAFVRVHDAHQCIPRETAEWSGSVLHSVSIMASRNTGLPVYDRHVAATPAGTRLKYGVFVSQTGYALTRGEIPPASIITRIGDEPIRSVHDFMTALMSAPDGSRVRFKYIVCGDIHRERVCVVTVDHKWFHSAIWVWNGRAGVWDSTLYSPTSTARAALVPAHTSYAPLAGGIASAAAAAVARALVCVECTIPHMCDGVHASAFIGCGIVCDAGRGIVVTDKNTVPCALCDVTLTFAGAVEVPARCIWLHPVHNIAFLHYEPALVGTTPVRGVRFTRQRLRIGDVCEFIGLTSTHACVRQTCTVTKIERWSIPDATPPRYREHNADALYFDRVAACLGGAFLAPNPGDNVDEDTDACIGAVWASYAYANAAGEPRETTAGMPVDMIQDVLLLLCSTPGLAHAQVAIPTLMCEWTPLSLSRARNGYSVPAADLEALEHACDTTSGCHRQALALRRASPRSHAATCLKEGDVLLAVDGKRCATFRDVEVAVDSSLRAAGVAFILPPAILGNEGDVRDAVSPVPVTLTIWRDDTRLDVCVYPALAHGRGSSDVVIQWCGMLIQRAHEAVEQRGFIPPCPCPLPPHIKAAPPYISRWSFGSPAHKAGVRAVCWITDINGHHVHDMHMFIEVIQSLQLGADVRLTCADTQGRVRVYTMRTDDWYWPTCALSRGAGAEWVLMRV